MNIYAVFFIQGLSDISVYDVLRFLNICSDPIFDQPQSDYVYRQFRDKFYVLGSDVATGLEADLSPNLLDPVSLVHKAVTFVVEAAHVRRSVINDQYFVVCL